ncbi:MAG: tRNA (adenosine(37)-N6)-threonylcarbamoyltransferase complex ATPase subunit type 1 TsaE [Chloroflexota bacterium]
MSNRDHQRQNGLSIITHSPEQTQEIGSIIGEFAQPGDLLLLVGDLGTGKTCLVQGIAWGMGLPGYASSPSFVLAREYPGSTNLYHIDLYRLENLEEIADLGIDDYLYGEGVCVVEWAEKAMTLFPQEHLLIELEHLTENERKLRFQAKGQRCTELLNQLKEQWNYQ